MCSVHKSHFQQIVHICAERVKCESGIASRSGWDGSNPSDICPVMVISYLSNTLMDKNHNCDGNMVEIE